MAGVTIAGDLYFIRESTPTETHAYTCHTPYVTVVLDRTVAEFQYALRRSSPRARTPQVPLRKLARPQN